MKEAYSRELRPEEYFKLSNGAIVRDIHELFDFLKTMNDVVFRHHVNDKRNDFSNWVRYMFNDRQLANDLLRLKNREPTLRRIEKRILELEKQEGEEELEILNQFKEKEKEIAEKEEQIQQQKVEVEQKQEEVEEKEEEVDLSLKEKIDDIIFREKEILRREEKIQEIELRLEGQLANQGKGTFFSKEFVQGIIVGVLVSLIVLLIYVKFLSQQFPDLFSALL